MVDQTVYGAAQDFLGGVTQAHSSGTINKSAFTGLVEAQNYLPSGFEYQAPAVTPPFTFLFQPLSFAAFQRKCNQIGHPDTEQGG
jgi:hypothetical protein